MICYHLLLVPCLKSQLSAEMGFDSAVTNY